MQINEYINRLIKISRDKKKYLDEMFILTQEQQKIIEAEDMERLNDLIDRKQAAIEAINSLDEEFQKEFKEVKAKYNINNIGELITNEDANFEELKEEISEIMASIENIKAIEKENSLALSEKKKEMADKIKELNRKKMASGKYMNESVIPPNPAFIDKKK